MTLRYRRTIQWLIVVIILSGCNRIPDIPINTQIPATATLTTSTPDPTATIHVVTATPTGLPTTLTATETATDTANGRFSVQDAATFVGENYPDNSVLAPGQAFIKTWEIKNTGSLIWTTAYQLVLSSSPQGETLGSPALINFAQSTAPGQTLSLAVPLVAPSTPGTYTTYWSIRNELGETVSVGGPHLWAKIQVCETDQSCTTPDAGVGTSAMVNSASVTVTNFAYDTQSATVKYCIAVPGLPDWRFLRAYNAWPSAQLFIDQESAPFLGGGSDFPSGDGCSFMQYQVGASVIEQAQRVTFVIDTLRMDLPPGDPDAICQSARSKLVTQYPGLDFKCHFSMAGFYTDLQKPDGMLREQADKIVMDAIQGAIYGPWTLVLK